MPVLYLIMWGLLFRFRRRHEHRGEEGRGRRGRGRTSRSGAVGLNNFRSVVDGRTSAEEEEAQEEADARAEELEEGVQAHEEGQPAPTRHARESAVRPQGAGLLQLFRLRQEVTVMWLCKLFRISSLFHIFSFSLLSPHHALQQIFIQ